MVVEARIYRQQGEEARRSRVELVGKIDGDSWNASSAPDRRRDVCTSCAPHGLEDARLASDDERAHRPAAPPVEGRSPEPRRSLRLGTLDHDIKGIEIVRYVAPIVVVKVDDETAQSRPNAFGLGGLHRRRKNEDGKYDPQGGHDFGLRLRSSRRTAGSDPRACTRTRR